jgi:adenine-specific DNA-methyltransferase
MDKRKALGQFFTPREVAIFMARLAKRRRQRLAILDPGAGTGILAAALCERLTGEVEALHIDAYEADPTLAEKCTVALTYTREWLNQRRVAMSFSVLQEDFVMANAGAIAPQLLAGPAEGNYDVAIMNPPYFKLTKADPRARALAAISSGQPNIYALFIAVALARLMQGGTLVAITPRSFATGPYFSAFRKYVFAEAALDAVHLFESRRDAFRKDRVLQENVIVRLRKRRTGGSGKVAITTSHGRGDIGRAQRRLARLDDVLKSQGKDVVISLPTSDWHSELVDYLSEWPTTVEKAGFRVSTGPVVAFRAEGLLRRGTGPDRVPLLWLQNIRPMKIEWPVPSQKPQYIHDDRASARKLLLSARNMVLVRRFTAKEDVRRLTAAALVNDQLGSGLIGLENHLNYISKWKGDLHSDVATGLAALLNSRLLDDYLRMSNGHTQINAADLRAMPLPGEEALRTLGAASAGVTVSSLDGVVADVLGLPVPLKRRLSSPVNGHR